jgi:hypothetical protein
MKECDEIKFTIVYSIGRGIENIALNELNQVVVIDNLENLKLFDFVDG